MQYEPGTVARATVRGVPDVQVMRCGGPGASGRNQVPFWWSAEYADDHRRHPNSDVTDVRPLVVLDLPDGALAGWPVVLDALQHGRERTGMHMTFSGLIDQIEAQTRPPKPPQPMARGAVVRDHTGLSWVRVHPGGAAWVNGYESWAAWGDIDAAEVLSPGVEQ